MKYLLLIGRILYSLIFLLTVTSHYKKEVIEYAASQGVPAASFLVPLSALLAFLGGYSIAVGYHAKKGAWLIIFFLIPVTLYMHAFWKETDPMQMKMQTAHFMKNISLLGAALIISYLGAGPLSLDERMNSVKNNTTQH